VRAWAIKLVRFVRYKPLGAVGGAILSLMVFVAIFAPYIATTDPTVQDASVRLDAPSSQALFGVDNHGRDVFSRVIYGTRISFYVGIMAVLIGTVTGVILGVTSGYAGGWFDLLVQRVVDALLGFPSIVLAMVLVVALGPSLTNVTLAIGLILIPRMTRLSRSSALSVKEEVYVTAAQAIGCSGLRIVGRHIVPNSLAPVFVLATGYLGTAIVTEASLSFLGLGIPPPAPSWGGMIQAGARGFMEAAPWLVVFPGLALSAAVFGFALFGDSLRDVLDPRLRGR
jgi:peptide/nickel transport system permease protein